MGVMAPFLKRTQLVKRIQLQQGVQHAVIIDDSKV